MGVVRPLVSLFLSLDLPETLREPSCCTLQSPFHLEMHHLSRNDPTTSVSPALCAMLLLPRSETLHSADPHDGWLPPRCHT
jgi:hypothetical protein